MVGEVGRELLIVGLGNPGKKYEMTRHNIGFITLEAFARRNGFSLAEERRFKAKAAVGTLCKKRVHLLMPETYMNESGLSVRRYSDFYRIGAEETIVVADDVALPFGMLRVRGAGSAGGHNGLKSICRELGSDRYMRLRMGVGAKSHPDQELADHVLGRFNAEEVALLPAFIEAGVATLVRMVDEELSVVMNAVNKRVLSSVDEAGSKGSCIEC